MMINAMIVYDPRSGGGAELSEVIEAPRIRHLGSKFKGSASKTVLNWGTSTERLTAIDSKSSGIMSEIMKCRVINPFEKVDLACDKLKTFQIFKDKNVPTPEFTTSRTEAVQWAQGGHMVFARTMLRSHSGKGIVIMDPDHPDTWEGVTAQLFVKYIPKKFEYRIHVVKGVVTDTQRKALRQDIDKENVNFKIRNHANGFIYARNEDHVVPQIARDVAVQAVTALGLDFGAADIILNEKSGRAYCLEVNCAPGLAGETVTNYAKVMKEF